MNFRYFLRKPYSNTNATPMNDFPFPKQSTARPISIGGASSPVALCLEQALEQIPYGVTLKSVELHWPHADTGFQPLIVVKCDNDQAIRETFSLFEGDHDFERWTSTILFILLEYECRTNTVQVSYDPFNAIVTFAMN